MNLHMRHLEDLAFGNPQELNGLRKILEGFQDCTTELSEKIDGAPSFIFGADFDGNPFVCYKSGINKPFYSVTQIRESDVACKDKLASIWPFVRLLVELNSLWGEAWQCDLVYHDKAQLKKVCDLFCVQPNLITYAFVSDEYEVAIAPHTKYLLEEDGEWRQWEGSHKFDLRIPRSVRIVQNIVSPDLLSVKHSQIHTQASYCLDFPSEGVWVWESLDRLGIGDDIEFALNKFANEKGGTMYPHDFVQLLEARLVSRFTKEQERLKTEKGINAKKDHLIRCLSYMETAIFRGYVHEAVKVYNRLGYLKYTILEKEHLLSTVPTVELNNALFHCLTSKGEGFVLRNADAAAKLVDRPRFSRLNSNKSTVKGWHETNIQDTTSTDVNDQ